MFGDDRILPRRSSHSRGFAVGTSILTHAIAGALGMWLSSLPRSFPSTEHAPVVARDDLIWVATTGPGGGGGGGGDKTPVAAPVREVGRDRLTVPTIRSKPAPVEKPKELQTTEQLTIPVQPAADAMTSLPGSLAPPPSIATTQGPGAGGGAGIGDGTGSGEGRGSGLGPGFGGGTGGGAYRPGAGITAPELVREVPPDYTAKAMRAKVQGLVLLECVVLTDGTVGDVNIIKSLDKVFGLDEQAIKAAKQWRFRPGRRFGVPVPVIVTIELSFTLR